MNIHQLIDRLSKIPRVQRMIIYGGLYVILAVGYWTLLYMPTSSDISGLESQQRQLTQQKKQVEARAKNKEQFKEEVQGLVNDLTQALKELPNDREIPGLLKGISALGKKVGLEIQKFSPLPEIKREYVAEVPVEIELKGSFHEVAMFFDRLAKMNRIVYVRDIEMGAPVERGGKVQLAVSGQAVTFRFLNDDEIEATQAKGKGKRGRKKRKAKGQ